MLHVAFGELPAGAEQQVLAQHARAGMDERHRVLQLVAETVGSAGLVVAAARPHAAGDGLVHQPAVGQQVQRRIGCPHLHGAECVTPVRMHRGERRPRGGAAAVALHQLSGLVRAAAHAEAEDDFARLPGRELDHHLDRPAGVERGAGAAREAGAPQRGRAPQRPVAADEFVAVGGHRTGDAVGGVDVEEGDPVAEVVAVAVAGVERAVVGRDLGVHMRRVLLTQVAEHPFDVAGGGEAAAARAVVAQHQARELHRIVERDEYRQLAVHRRLVVLEHAVAEAVADAVRRCGLVVARVARGRPRGRRPDLAAVLVAQEDLLAAGVGHRVVVPGREPQLMGVLAPGVGAPGLRHDRAEARVGDDVDPGRGRPMHAVGGDHVLTPVGREAAECR